MVYPCHHHLSEGQEAQGLLAPALNHGRLLWGQSPDILASCEGRTSPQKEPGIGSVSMSWITAARGLEPVMLWPLDQVVGCVGIG